MLAFVMVAEEASMVDVRFFRVCILRGRWKGREQGGGWVVGRENPAVWYRGLDGVPEFFVPGRLRRVRGWFLS